MQSFLLHKVSKVDKDARIFIERYISSDFGLYAYKTNYVIPLSFASTKYPYWSENGVVADAKTYDKKYEVEFQLSLKKPLFFNLLGQNEIIIFAYTQKVWWQLYSPSSPFRETNYEPEIFITFPTSENIDKKSGLKGIRFGFAHESNGRSGLHSRSWNRLYFSSMWQFGNLFTNFRLWHRISEDAKVSPTDLGGDDNPDIEDYMGYGDLSFSYLYRKQQITLLLRNNLDFNGDNKGALSVDWSLPIPYAKDSFWYIKLFSGYGESLIDYNRRVDKIAFGFSFSRGLF
jgi:phospholipase A1